MNNISTVTSFCEICLGKGLKVPMGSPLSSQDNIKKIAKTLKKASLPVIPVATKRKRREVLHIPSENKSSNLQNVLSITIEEAIARGKIECVKAHLSMSPKNKTELLVLAIAYGQLAIIKLLLERGARVNVPNSRSVYPLHAAAFKGCATTVELLLKSGAKLNVKNILECAPLHEAASNGHVEVMKLLIDAKANLEAQCMEKCTPLHEAASFGKNDSVKLLIKERANLQALNFVGDTPLHAASLQGQTSTVKLLLKMGANAYVRNKLGGAPVHLAQMRGHDEVEKLLSKKPL